MNKLLLLFIIPLLMGCGETPKNYKVEFNSGKVYRVRAICYFADDHWVDFYRNKGIFPKDSIKSITIENYE